MITLTPEAVETFVTHDQNAGDYSRAQVSIYPIDEITQTGYNGPNPNALPRSLFLGSLHPGRAPLVNMQQLNDSHQLTIDAFRTAIQLFEQNGKPLPDEINAIADDLENNIAILDRLSENNSDFETYYQNARLDLQAKAAERNKLLNPPHENPRDTQPVIRRQSSQSHRSGQPTNGTAIKTLTPETTDPLPAQPTITPTIAKETILKKLAQTPLRTQDLSYVLNEPLDRTQTLVQQLWKAGYIDRLDSGLLPILLPNLRKAEYRNQSIDPKLFLTVTAKGYSHLYPVFQWAKRGEQ